MATTPAPAPYRLRSITPDDWAGLRQFYAALSPESRASRFHGAALTIPEATATFFCGPDHQHREGIVAERLDADGDHAIIGHVCMEPLSGNEVEMAIAVADAWQGHGVGRAMLSRAIVWARRHGINRVVASMQCGNTGMTALLRSIGYPVGFGAFDAGTIDAYLDLRSSRSLAA